MANAVSKPVQGSDNAAAGSSSFAQSQAVLLTKCFFQHKRSLSGLPNHQDTVMFADDACVRNVFASGI